MRLLVERETGIVIATLDDETKEVSLPKQSILVQGIAIPSFQRAAYNNKKRIMPRDENFYDALTKVWCKRCDQDYTFIEEKLIPKAQDSPKAKPKKDGCCNIM